MRLVPVLVFAMGLGFLGAAVGSWTGAMISFFVTVITGGIGAAAAPLITLAGGIAGGVFGFVKGMELAHTELGHQASKALAPNFAQNEEVMKWIDLVYRGMIGIENQVMVGFRGTADQLVAIGDKMQMEGRLQGATTLSKASGVLISAAGRIGQGVDLGIQGVKAVPDVYAKGVNTLFDVGRNDRFAQEKGFSDYAAYAAFHQSMKDNVWKREMLDPGNRQSRIKKKVVPDDIFMNKRDRDRKIGRLNKAFKRNQEMLARDPTQVARIVPRLAEINQEILNLINAPIDDASGNYIINHQEIKDASSNTTTVQQSTTVVTNQGANINAFGVAPSGRF